MAGQVISHLAPDPPLKRELEPRPRFASHKPINQQTWHIRLSEAGAKAICEAPKFGITFDRKSFAGDPRIAKLRWVRA